MEPWLTQAGTLTGAGLCSFAAWRAALALKNGWLNVRRKRSEFLESLRSFEQELTQRETPVETSRIPGDWKGYRRFRIERIVRESTSIKSFYLVPEDGLAIPRFKPGNYLTIRTVAGEQAKPIVRCYSLSSRPMGDRFRISVKREEHGAMSRFLHDLPIGSIIDAQSPRGEFTPEMNDSRPLVLIGSGIGITPLLSMADTLLHSQEQRPVALFYGVRNKAEHAFGEEIARLTKEHSRFHAITCYSRPAESDVKRVDYDLAKRIDAAIVLKSLGSTDFPFYLCGPGPFMESLVGGLAAGGVRSEDIHFEAFGPSSLAKPEKTTNESAPAKPIARVTFERTGKAAIISSPETTLLEAAEASDVSIPAGCRAGNCGSCAIRIAAGEVTYRKRPTADIPSGHCLACVAVPKSDDLHLDV